MWKILLKLSVIIAFTTINNECHNCLVDIFYGLLFKYQLLFLSNYCSNFSFQLALSSVCLDYGLQALFLIMLLHNLAIYFKMKEKPQIKCFVMSKFATPVRIIYKVFMTYFAEK